jgi:hypothetical protein
VKQGLIDQVTTPPPTPDLVVAAAMRSLPGLGSIVQSVAWHGKAWCFGFSERRLSLEWKRLETTRQGLARWKGNGRAESPRR